MFGFMFRLFRAEIPKHKQNPPQLQLKLPAVANSAVWMSLLPWLFKCCHSEVRVCTRCKQNTFIRIFTLKFKINMYEYVDFVGRLQNKWLFHDLSTLAHLTFSRNFFSENATTLPFLFQPAIADPIMITGTSRDYLTNSVSESVQIVLSNVQV